VHDFTDIEEVADTTRSQMNEDITKLVETVDRCREMIELEERNRLAFRQHIDAVESQVCDEAQRLKATIDQGKEWLLKELASYRSADNKQIDHVVEATEEHASLLDSLVAHMKTLRDNGTAYDVVSQNSTLHERAAELEKLDVIWQAANAFESFEVKFSPRQSICPTVESSRANVIGEIIGKRVDGNFFKLDVTQVE